MSGLSIIIPVYQESKNLNKLIHLINKSLIIKKFEIIIIDDDSSDGSLEILKKLIKKFKNLKFFIRKNKPRDLSRSCVMGFNKAKFDTILVMDGDLQHRPQEINKLYFKLIKDECDIVVGSRQLLKKKNKGLKFYRLISSIVLIFFVNLILGFKTNDPMSGFFIFKKKIFLNTKKNYLTKVIKFY